MCSCYVEKIRLRLKRKAVAIQVALGNHDPPIELFHLTSRHVTSRNVTSVILVSQNNENCGHAGSKPVLCGVELFSYVKKTFFCPNKFAYLLATLVKKLYISFLFNTILAQPYGENEYAVFTTTIVLREDLFH